MYKGYFLTDNICALGYFLLFLFQTHFYVSVCKLLKKKNYLYLSW